MLYQSLAVAGAQQAVPAMAVGVVSLVIFFLSLLMLPGNLYYSNDIKPILAYPVRCAELLSSRFLPALLYEYMFSAFVLIPAFVSFGVASGAGVLYYAVAAVVFLFTPILPLVASGILVMLMMRFTSLFRNRDLLTKVGSLLLLAAVLFFNFKMSGAGGDFALDPGQALNIAEAVTSSVNRIFFTAPIAGLAMTGASALSMLGGALLFVAVSAAGYALFLLCGEKLYRAGLLGLDNTSAKRVKMESGALRRMARRQNPAVAIAKKDFRIMLRSPVFFMNNLVACFLMPLILLFPILLQYEEMSLLFAQLGLSGMTPDSPVGVRRAHSGPGPCRVCHCDKRHFRLRHLPGRFQLYIQPFRARQDGAFAFGQASSRPCGELSFRSAYTGRRLCRDRSVPGLCTVSAGGSYPDCAVYQSVRAVPGLPLPQSGLAGGGKGCQAEFQRDAGTACLHSPHSSLGLCCICWRAIFISVSACSAPC